MNKRVFLFWIVGVLFLNLIAVGVSGHDCGFDVKATVCEDELVDIGITGEYGLTNYFPEGPFEVSECDLWKRYDKVIKIELIEHDVAGDDEVGVLTEAKTTYFNNDLLYCPPIYIDHIFQRRLSDWTGLLEGDTIELFIRLFHRNLNETEYKIFCTTELELKYVDVITGQCSGGACCDMATCNYKSSSAICEDDGSTDYGCPWGTELEDDVGVRHKDRYCSGLSSECDGSLGGWKSWAVNDDCAANELCIDGNADCQKVACLLDNDCPTDSWTGNPWCDGNDVWQIRRDFQCTNPGTINANCSFSDNAQLKEKCVDLCSDGSCVAVECNSDSDCGTDGWVGSPYCSGGNIWQSYKEWTCSNPGTASALCSYSNSDQLKASCAYGCDNSACIDVECSSNSDCGANGWVGSSYCKDGNVWQAYREWICNNPGTASALCSYSNSDQLKASCAYDCANGKCRIACGADSDCGEDDWVGSSYCSGGNIWQSYREWTCSNPGTGIANCSFSDTAKLKESCSEGCSEGACEHIACSTSSDCGSGYWYGFPMCRDNEVWDYYVTFSCENPGTTSAKCWRMMSDRTLKETCDYTCSNGFCVTSCTTDADCGGEILVFVGDPWCDGTEAVQTVRSNVCLDSSCAYSYHNITKEVCEHFCLNGSCALPKCFNSSDCGADGRVGSSYCKDGNVWQAYREWICNNPGIADASCSYLDVDQLKENCTDNCSNGACINFFDGFEDGNLDGWYGYNVPDPTTWVADNTEACSGAWSATTSATKSSDPDDHLKRGFVGPGVLEFDQKCHVDGYTSGHFNLRFHIDGEQQEKIDYIRNWEHKQYTLSSGSHTLWWWFGVYVDGENAKCWLDNVEFGVPDCYSNLDCGEDRLVDSPYCNGSEVWQSYMSHTCNNPGQIEASCSISIKDRLKKSCGFGCFEGDCVACSEDQDCGSAGFIGDSWCNGSEVWQTYRDYSCSNPGISSALCFYTDTEHFKEDCPNGCLNGSCIVVCSSDLDCGTDDWVGSSYCNDGDVWQAYREWTCSNPGTKNSSCSYSDNDKLKYYCMDGCLNSSCDFINEGFEDGNLDGWYNLGYKKWEASDETAHSGIWSAKGSGVNYFPYSHLFKNIEGPTTISFFWKLSPGTYPAYYCYWDDSMLFKIDNEIIFATDKQDWTQSEWRQKVYNIPAGTHRIEWTYVKGHYSGPECAGWIDDIDLVDYPLCLVNSDCGADDLVGSSWCSDGNVWQAYREWTCNNHGTINASCSYLDIDQLKENCAYGCDDGKCAECLTDSNCGVGEWIGLPYCREGDVWQVYRAPVCLNPGMADAKCDYSENTLLKQDCGGDCANGVCAGVVCGSDLDCGNDGWIGEAYCSGMNVWQSYRTYNCLNSGTPSSYCSHSDDAELKHSCDSCLNGKCVDIECYSNSDCGKNRWRGDKYCKDGDIWQEYRKYKCYNKGTAASYCDYYDKDRLRRECAHGCSDGMCSSSAFVCSSDSDCGTDGLIGGTYCSEGDVRQNSRQWTCHNPGTANAYCSYSDDEQLIESCEGDCVGSACIGAVCDIDSDCGTDSWIGNPYCNEDIVYQIYREWTCAVPGTDSCSYSDSPKLKETCDVRCLNGVCVDEEGFGDSDYDLRVSHFLIQSEDPTAGNPVTLAFNLENGGNRGVEEVEWRLDTGSGSSISGFISGMKVGKGILIFKKVTYSNPGTYYPKITVDPNNKINEFDEENNQKSIILEIGG